MGRAVARHPSERPGDARRRPPAARPHRRASVPAEGPRRRRAAVAPDPSRRRAGPGRVRARASIPTRTRSRSCCARSPSSTRCAAIRPVEATLALLDELGLPTRPGRGCCVVRRSARRADGALPRHDRRRNPIVDACATSDRAEARWVSRLAERYPGDPSVVATLLLNLVHLAPGEALRLGPGNLHAYLHGAGIELMGAERQRRAGGLTRKPVDVDELLRVVDTTPLAEPVIAAATAIASTTMSSSCGSKPATATAPSATRFRSTSAARRGTWPPATSASSTVDHLHRHWLTLRRCARD